VADSQISKDIPVFMKPINSKTIYPAFGKIFLYRVNMKMPYYK